MTITLAQAIEQYLSSRRGRHAEATTKQDVVIMRRFLAGVGDIQVRNLKAAHVEEFFLALRRPHTGRDGVHRKPITASSWNFYRSRIAQLAKFCQTRGLLRDDIMALVEPMKKERRRRLQATPDVMWQMLDSARDARDRALLATSMNTGLRGSEITRLKVGDVDLDTLTLRVTITKTHEVDDLPVTSDLAEELTRWLTSYRRRCLEDFDRVLQQSDYLFPARRGGVYAYRTTQNGDKVQYRTEEGIDPLRPVRRPYTIVQDALKAVGLPHVHEGCHTIRRSVARIMFDDLVADGGYDNALRIVSSFLHHSTVAVTEAYIGVSSERKKRDDHLRGRSLLGPRPSVADVRSIR